MFSCPLLSFYTIVKLVPVQPYLHKWKLDNCRSNMKYEKFCDRVMINYKALIRLECKMTVI